ncbi:NADPH-dependent oxidoreductase with 4Fe-4S binding domain, in cluster with PFOR [invertebrate metagenome]|uniref:NADPH-dependent oxidoreductase with 4Fe-4S binding domain, in cluster with PFOR n=1 Tax=invertebrate metagenome TaxID=1711999 RepID=A0A484H878_9ZZZZ
MQVLTRGGYALPGTSIEFKTGTWRTSRPLHKHWAAPCHSACPAGEDPQAYIAKIQENHPREAWESIVHINPIPSITGRICPHPCEQACNRGHFDQPLAIHAIERFLGDEARQRGWEYPMDLGRGAGATVAVIGAGPAGLSAAYHLRRRGYQVTLLDALPEAGGLMRSAIPINRLPRDVLDADIARILALGIEFRGRTRLGVDVHLDELRSDYRALFLAPGTAKAKAWSVDGAVPTDHRTALELLQEWVAVGSLPAPRSVIVHGGGNTAVDLCRAMKRAGVKEVHLITASGLPGPDTEPDDIINIVPRELEQAIEEGIAIHPHRTIQRLLFRGSRVVGVEMVTLRKLPTKSGRTGRIAFEGTETLLHADMVIPAIGESVDPTGLGTLLGGSDYLRPGNLFGRLDHAPGLFVGGDARGDRGTVSAAVGDGRLAAAAIDAYIRQGDDPEVVSRAVIDFNRINLSYFEPAKRVEEPTLSVAERTDTAEIDRPLSSAAITQESNRCFSCGSCLACDNCWTFCPDNAVVKTVALAKDGSHYVFDYEYCKGCGVCAAECPCGYIVMEAEL